MDVSQDVQLLINTVSTGVIAAATVVMMVISFSLLKENRRLRKIGSEPEVVAYLTTTKNLNNHIDFVLANVGKGPAKDVDFRFEGDEADFAAHNVRLRNKTERKPISVLPQDEKIVSYFGQGSRLFREPRLSPFRVTVNYKNLDGKVSTSIFVLDVSEFDGLVMAGSSPERQLAETASKIERTLSSFTRGGVLKVLAYTPDDLRALEVEERREFEQFKENITSD